MGYDGSNTLQIPIVNVYSPRALGVHHVSNADATIKGNDNAGCGHIVWPC
jgi:hypothetical protein